MDYKIIARKNPSTGKEKFYPTPVLGAPMTEAELAGNIEHNSTLSEADVKGALQSYMETISSHLLNNETVTVDDLGTFRVTIRSAGTEDKTKANASLIKGPHIVYLANASMKKAVHKSNGILTLSLVEPKKAAAVTPTNP